MSEKHFDIAKFPRSQLIEHFDWKDEYNLGIPSIDKDHQFLVSLLNRSIDVVNTNANNRHEIDSIIDEMMKYASFHFDREEQLMQKSHYPHFLDHQYEHQQFVVYIEQTIAQYECGEASAQKVLNFLKDWLVHHILDLDKDYAPYCNATCEIECEG